MFLLTLLFVFQLLICYTHGLKGYWFKDNLDSKRYVSENGEMTYTLPRWPMEVGYSLKKYFRIF